MKSLKLICEETDQTLSFLTEGLQAQQLEGVIKNWIDDTFTILAYRISVKNHNLIIIASTVNEAKEEKITVLRLFPMTSGRWAASTDIQFKDKQEVFQYLLNRFE